MQTRYYDFAPPLDHAYKISATERKARVSEYSTIGRFISPDSLAYLDPQTLNGLNLYAYCGNNPVMFTDPTGTTEWWEWALLAVGVAVAVTLVVVGSVITAGALAGSIAALIGATITGVGNGFLIAAGSNLVNQVIENKGDLSKVKPMESINEGLVGALIGGITGGLTSQLSYYGSAMGKGFGESLSRLTKNGISVGRVFGGADTVASVFGFIGKCGGIVIGGAVGLTMGNEILKKPTFVEEAINKGFSNLWGALGKSLKKLFCGVEE